MVSAWDSSSDKPCVVKILLNAGKANNQEACAVKILECGMDDNILLVKYKLIELILDESHSSTGHPPGRYELLISLRYVESLAKLTPVPSSSYLSCGFETHDTSIGVYSQS